MENRTLSVEARPATKKPLVVAVIAEQEADRVAISTAFAAHPGQQRVAFSASIELAAMLLQAHPRLDAMIGFIDEQGEWLRFRALASRFANIPSVVLVSDPESLDAAADGRILNAVAAVSREQLAKRAAMVAAQVLAQHGKDQTAITETDERDTEKLEALSNREREVLGLTASGLAIKEIAARIDRTYATVASHRARIMRKTGLHDKVALTLFAIRTGLIEA